MSSTTGNTLGNPYLERVYAATCPEESQRAYNEWASTYDSDMIEQGYIAPAICAQAIAQHGNIEGLILDAGCGSGSVGLELAKHGARSIDGLDYSPGMLQVAQKTGVYSKLETGDLSKELEIKNGTYDAVVCVGTLTQGHVGPVPALKEFVRIVKAGGVVVATVLETIWEKDGYETEIERLINEGQVKLISKEVQAYRKHAGVGGRVLILKKL
ncbi:S-adenosyl-L-methionine-dependent methyltransferase [Lojkania enalia]|uniref:S-adenosyl-L-methionine-dependent methyltransferase n=1 Tax=Lojkania enalia TaxID=147567 RepID=A0A9P4K1Y4_9PLEO|nr:S-adenosyl-L-methionine-dependent methyltransferase [Didymosphaeria enalia]